MYIQQAEKLTFHNCICKSKDEFSYIYIALLCCFLNLKYAHNALIQMSRLEPIVLLELSIMLLSIIPKTSLLCSKLCF